MGCSLTVTTKRDRGTVALPAGSMLLCAVKGFFLFGGDADLGSAGGMAGGFLGVEGMVPWPGCWVADKTGRGRSGEGKLL